MLVKFSVQKTNLNNMKAAFSKKSKRELKYRITNLSSRNKQFISYAANT